MLPVEYFHSNKSCFLFQLNSMKIIGMPQNVEINLATLVFLTIKTVVSVSFLNCCGFNFEKIVFNICLLMENLFSNFLETFDQQAPSFNIVFVCFCERKLAIVCDGGKEGGVWHSVNRSCICDVMLKWFVTTSHKEELLVKLLNILMKNVSCNEI